MNNKITKNSNSPTLDLKAKYFPNESKYEKNIVRNKYPIRLRAKKLTTGNLSLYLDFYSNGNREYEFLNLYLVPEKNKRDESLNKETLLLAETIKQEKIVEFQKGEHGFTKKTKCSKISFLSFIRQLADDALQKSGNKRSTYFNLLSLIGHFKEFKGENIKIYQIDKKTVLDFIDYLKHKAINRNNGEQLKANGQHKLYVKFKYCVEKAFQMELLNENPFKHIDKDFFPKTEQSKREYLTIEEVKKLIKTDCVNEHVKKSFLFCCLAGLRYGNVVKIKWADFYKDNNGKTVLSYIPVKSKSKKQEELQISDEALKFLPDPNEVIKDNYIFKLPKNERCNAILNKWVKDAGINKKITFHCSRHTAATTHLTLGTPIEVVSALLAHSKISTTQIYAKIVSDAKRAAVNKQEGIFI